MRQQPLQRDQIEHHPVALACEHQPLCLIGRRLRRREVGGEIRALTSCHEDVGVIDATIGVEPVEGCHRGVDIARHQGAACKPNAQSSDRARMRPVECLAIGGRGHRVAEGVE